VSIVGNAKRVRTCLAVIWQWSLLAAFFSIPSLAMAAVSAHVDRTFDRFSIVVRADADVSPEIAWAVLTDYNNLSRFVPDMSMSRVVSAPGEPVRVEQKGKEGLLSFVFPEQVVLAMEEQPIHRIRFRAVSGTVKSMQGEWLIIDEGHAVSVLYSAKVVAGRLVPPLLSESLLEKRLKEKMEGVIREMKRRAARAP
jgi:ribosome-associated toxin RatA of RatAB toxin-antitoxin module